MLPHVLFSFLDLQGSLRTCDKFTSQSDRVSSWKCNSCASKFDESSYWHAGCELHASERTACKQPTCIDTVQQPPGIIQPRRSRFVHVRRLTFKCRVMDGDGNQLVALLGDEFKTSAATDGRLVPSLRIYCEGSTCIGLEGQFLYMRYVWL